MVRENRITVLPGMPVLFFYLVLLLLIPVAILLRLPWLGALLVLPVFFMPIGFFLLEPNQAAVLMLFGDYKGSVTKEGLHWANPFLTKKKVSLRMRNFESAHLKVNDLDGNPIEIAAVIVWRIVDSAMATFNVEAIEQYVSVQTESALRHIATAYPYDAHTEGQTSLRSSIDQVVVALKKEVSSHVSEAGIEIIDARITHLAYSPEIATAMLQRQQASAIVSARSKIVEGAVGMVEMALDQLSKRSVVELDEERKAAMVSNLLVVLCGERGTQPVVNTGTIYH
jgi:regulator of protease activity HflC (stomatin/prohibitin superfamily)